MLTGSTRQGSDARAPELGPQVCSAGPWAARDGLLWADAGPAWLWSHMGMRGVLSHSTLTRSDINCLASSSSFPIGTAGETPSPRVVRRPGPRAAVSRVGAGQSIPLVPSDRTGGGGSPQAGGDKGSGTELWDWARASPGQADLARDLLPPVLRALALKALRALPLALKTRLCLRHTGWGGRGLWLRAPEQCFQLF